MPGPLGSFIGDFISRINELPTQHKMLVVGDFNLDQMLLEHVAKVNPLIQNFNLSQHVLFCCHTSVITLFFFSKSDALFYTEFSCKQFSFQSPLPNS